MSFNKTAAIHTIVFINWFHVSHSSYLFLELFKVFACVQCFHIFIIVIVSYSPYFQFVPTVPFNKTVAIHTIVFFKWFYIFHIYIVSGVVHSFS